MITDEELENREVRFSFRYYWIIFGALLILLRFFPIRVISDWWINPVLYAMVTFACSAIIIYLVFKSLYKNIIIFLIIICMSLSFNQILISYSEIDNCWIEDNRYTKLFYCNNGNSYQQIENFPIGMENYCYYCIWYK